MADKVNLADLIDGGGLPTWLLDEVHNLIEQAERVFVGVKLGNIRKGYVRDTLVKLLAARGIKANKLVVGMLIELILATVRRFVKIEPFTLAPLNADGGKTGEPAYDPNAMREG